MNDMPSVQVQSRPQPHEAAISASSDEFILRYDAENFPCDIPWTTFFHDKGHACRASPQWRLKYLNALHERGEDPRLSACWIWAMALMGHPDAHLLHTQLVSISAQAAYACLDQNGSREFMKIVSERLLAESLEWTTPTDTRLRGWSKIRQDEDIEKTSREKFARGAVLCQRAAEIGFDRDLQRALSDAVPLSGETQRLATTAIGIVLSAMQAAPQALEQSIFSKSHMMGLCAMSVSPKTFRQALALCEPEVVNRMALAGSSLRRAFELSQGELPAETGLSQPAARFGTRRLLDHLRHFSNFSSTRELHDNGASFAYIDSILGPGNPSRAIEELAKLSGEPSQQFTTFASLCADVFSKRLSPISMDQSTVKHIWDGHIRSHPGAGAGVACSNSATYAARHLALSSWFPEEDSEAQSRSMADGPTLAAIEHGELRRIVPAFVPEKLSVDDGPNIFAGLESTSRLPAKKNRL